MAEAKIIRIDTDRFLYALKAGSDIVLMPENLEIAFNAVKTAVKTGNIAESRIDESVLRIMKLRLKYGVDVEQ